MQFCTWLGCIMYEIFFMNFWVIILCLVFVHKTEKPKKNLKTFCFKTRFSSHAQKSPGRRRCLEAGGPEPPRTVWRPSGAVQRRPRNRRRCQPQVEVKSMNHRVDPPSIALRAVLVDLVHFVQLHQNMFGKVFSERELMFMFAICRRSSVCHLSVVCLSVVCNVRAPYSAD